MRCMPAVVNFRVISGLYVSNVIAVSLPPAIFRMSPPKVQDIFHLCMHLLWRGLSRHCTFTNRNKWFLFSKARGGFGEYLFFFAVGFFLIFYRLWRADWPPRLCRSTSPVPVYFPEYLHAAANR